MIEEHIKIHDDFSIEIKVGFLVDDNKEVNDFSMNMWVFIPNSLDINKYTFSKQDFYRDVKSNIRLVTPSYELDEIANTENLPFKLLYESFEFALADAIQANIDDFETHIKMFQSILKSSLRDTVNEITKTEHRSELIRNFKKNVALIATNYRKMGCLIPESENKIREFYSFGDEFMSNQIELHSLKILKGFTTIEKDKKQILTLINSEINYKKAHKIPVVEVNSSTLNRDLISRFSTLKKYMESQLFLKKNVKEDGALVRQFYYSVAAGISMFFATIIAFSFQQKYGNFTLPLFIALVVGYMLKDRIKELSRFYFSQKLDSKYYDNRTEISFKKILLGWYKESQTFIKEQNVPQEIIQLRSRSAILEAENRMNDEKIILYRMRVQLDKKEINKANIYPIPGVNNIIRFNLTPFLTKMDDPYIPLYVPDELDGQTEYKIIKGEKIYYLNLILQYESQNQLNLKRYRIAFNREGIKNLEKF